MKMKKYLIIALTLIITLVSCNIEMLPEGESVNEYIFPYMEFTLSPDGTYYTASVIKGASLESIFVPAYVAHGGESVPVKYFAGFKSDGDIVNLKSVELESSITEIKLDSLNQASILSSIKYDKVEQGAKWGDLPVIEKEGVEFLGWFIEGTENEVRKGENLIPGFTTIVPRWNEHRLRYVSEVNATCTQNGTRAHYKCLSCQKLYSDEDARHEITLQSLVIPASHTLKAVEAKKATCTEDGNGAYYRCDVCHMCFSDSDGKSFLEEEDTVIKAKGHTPVEIPAEEPTCIDAGNTAYYVCRVCSRYFSDRECKVEITDLDSTVIPRKEHSWDLKHDTNGHWYECSYCHSTKESSGHSFTIEKVTKEPTYMEAGEKEFTCDVCGETITEDLAPVGGYHSWDDGVIVSPTCTERGYTLYSCTESGCNVTYKSEYKDALGHELSPTAKKEATCTVDGHEAYYKCSRCLKYFSDSEGKKQIGAPVVIPMRGHNYEDSEYHIDDTKGVHYRICMNTDCGERLEEEHVYKEITEDRTPVKSQTCTEGAVYKKSCICGKESNETFISGTGRGHSEPVEHPSVASTCSTRGNRIYYTCEHSCCLDKYYEDRALTIEVRYDDLLLDYAEHVYAKKNFEKTESTHTWICDECNEKIKTENHTKSWTHDYFVHHWKCEICGYTSAEEKHTLTGEPGKRTCECGYIETESQNEGGSFDVKVIDRTPSGKLTAVQDGTRWTFTLTNTNENAVPDSYTWYMDGAVVAGEESSTFVLYAPSMRTYRVMCVFTANGRYASQSMTIDGGN